MSRRSERLNISSDVMAKRHREVALVVVSRGIPIDSSPGYRMSSSYLQPTEGNELGWSITVLCYVILPRAIMLMKSLHLVT